MASDKKSRNVIKNRLTEIVFKRPIHRTRAFYKTYSCQAVIMFFITENRRPMQLGFDAEPYPSVNSGVE